MKNSHWSNPEPENFVDVIDEQVAYRLSNHRVIPHAPCRRRDGLEDRCTGASLIAQPQNFAILGQQGAHQDTRARLHFASYTAQLRYADIERDEGELTGVAQQCDPTV